MCSFLGCSISNNKIENTTIIEGKISYSFFRFESFYNLDNELINTFQAYLDSVDINNCEIEDKEFVQNYQKLKEMNLLYKPYLHIVNTKSEKFIAIFEDESKYKDVLIATRENMLNNYESIYASLKAINLVNELYLIKDVISVKIVSGYSGCKDNKLEVEDYR